MRGLFREARAAQKEKGPGALRAPGRKSLVAVITAKLLLREEKQGAEPRAAV